MKLTFLVATLLVFGLVPSPNDLRAEDESKEQILAGGLVCVRRDYAATLDQSGVTTRGGELRAMFLRFENDFAVFRYPDMKGTLLYIPKDKIEFIVAKAPLQ